LIGRTQECSPPRYATNEKGRDAGNTSAFEFLPLTFLR